MKTLRLFSQLCIGFLLLAFANSDVLAAPSISSASGTFNHGSSVTIAGSGFGTKATAAPIIWDNFESGTLGNNIPGSNPAIGPAWGGVGNNPVYSSSVVRTGSTKSSFHNFDGTSNDSGLQYVNTSLTTVYFSYWWNVHKTSANWSRNVKPWMEWGSDPGTMPMLYAGFGNPDDNDGSLRSAVYDVGGGTAATKWGPTAIQNIQSEWIRLEFYLKQSDPNVANGAYQGWVHRPDAATPSINLDLNVGTSVVMRTTSNTWKTWVFGLYYTSDTYTPPPTGAVYIDDFYFDSTPARIEIGNASTWSACTHREIQVPLAWSSSSITATVNMGSFPGGTAYLYVVDSTGAVNTNGYAITLGERLPIVSINATDVIASETGSNPGTFRVTRTGSTANALAVNYTVGGTATNGTDYTPTLSGTVTIAAGSSTADITITPVDDSLVEGGETVTLTINANANYTVGSPFSDTVQIEDNDSSGIPTFVQSAGLVADGNSGSISATFPSYTFSGDTVVVAVTWDVSSGAALSSCTDSQGHTYTLAANRTDTGNSQAIGIYYYVGTTAAANTVTVHFSNNNALYRAIAIHEYSGIASASPVDGTATNVATCTSAADNVTSTAVTTTANNDLIFGVTRTNGGGGPTITAGTGFTKRRSDSSPARLVTEDRLQTTAGSVAATFTFSQSWAYLTEMVAFKASSSAPAFGPGDCNGDYKVDGVDLATLSQNWDPLGANGSHTWAQGDFNGDGKIDGIDLAALAQKWSPLGYTSSSSPNVTTLSAPANSSPSKAKGEGRVRVLPSAARRLVPWPTESPK